MSNIEPPFTPIQPVDGYLPIADHGLLGDGETAALVARDGTVNWLCVPQFDSEPLFAGLLDAGRGGHWRVTLEGAAEARQYYLGETGVLVTELSHGGAAIRITDALALNAGADLARYARVARGEFVRCVEVLRGPARLALDLQTYFRVGGSFSPSSGGWHARCSGRDLELRFEADRPLPGPCAKVDLQGGERLHVTLRWRSPGRRRGPEPPAVLADTVDAWHRWRDGIRYEGPHAPLVRRAAITLKMLDHVENGAMVAAPTTSLPEQIGGQRNWDYRYSWIRDATFCVYALNRIRLHHESSDYLAWLLDAVERNGGTPRVFYTLQGHPGGGETADQDLRGYRHSHPVRWGNGAGAQRQNDVYGEVLDCAYLWAREGGAIDPPLWERLMPCIEGARQRWNTSDHGIWEVRTTERPFTYSAAMCQVAVDRGARLAERLGLPGDVAAWRRDAEAIRAAIRELAWSEKLQSFAQHLRFAGEGVCDASLLALPLRRVIPATDPRMAATTAAVQRHLGAGKGLLYRYDPERAPDGLPGTEGAFLLCSFWLVDNLALQGRVDDALALYDTLCGHANALGLLPEQIDPSSGEFLGNYPQAFSHVGLITSGVGLAAAMAK